MYPDFSYFVSAVFGTDTGGLFSLIKTFGLFLALVFVVGGFFLVAEMKRKEAEGLLPVKHVQSWVGKSATIWEILSNALVGFLLGFKGVYAFMNGQEMIADAPNILLSMKGNWIGGLIGGLLFGFARYWEKNREVLPTPELRTFKLRPYEQAGNLVILAAISGLIGAKLFAVMETPKALLADPIGMLFSGSGLAVYGGLIGAFIAMPFFIRRMGFKVIHIMDAAAPSLALGYGVGRMGCHFSGDGDWGDPSDLADRPDWLSWLPDWTWTHHYPHNVINEGIPIPGCEKTYCMMLEPGVYPTPIYEIIMAFIIFAILWSLRKRIKVAGLLFFIYLFLNGLERFSIEMIRVNTDYTVFGIALTQAQMIAILFMLTGLTLGLVFWRRHKAGKPIVF